jgi:hypothetical protein
MAGLLIRGRLGKTLQQLSDDRRQFPALSRRQLIPKIPHARTARGGAVTVAELLGFGMSRFLAAGAFDPASGSTP